MTRTTPPRRTILHLSQIRFTEALTFIAALFSHLLAGPHPRSPAHRRSYVAGFAVFLFVLAGPHPRSPAHRRSYVAGFAVFLFVLARPRRARASIPLRSTLSFAEGSLSA